MEIPITFTNEVIPASAGTGKTFQLTDKFINLMNQGVKPENIVALTFTNKASAEFFEGILEKLAKSSKHSDDPNLIRQITGVPELKSDEALKLLRTFINSMPSLELGTLDSFLYKMINHIPFEIGISGEFEILTEHEASIVREKVCRKVFNDKVSSDDFLIAFKLASFGKEGSGMLFKLNQFIERAHSKFIYNPEPNLWGNKSRIWPDGFHWEVLEKKALKENINRLSTLIEETEVKEKVATKLRSFFSWIIETKPGNPVPKIHETIHKNFLDAFKDIQLGNAKINVERNKFEISGEMSDLFSQVISHIIGLQLETHLMRTRGLWKVLQSYEDEYGENIRQKGRLTYSDFPYFLSKNNWSTSNMIDILEYRIDAKYDHWLLDEFQDTSREQWNAIENLIDECAMDPEFGRSVFIVGDIKQSIYAWRGGDTKIFKEQREKYRNQGSKRFKETNLDESRRSSQPVITTVNSIFGNTDKLHQIFPSIEGRWEYEKHTTVHHDRPGFTSWTCAKKVGRHEKLNTKLELTAEIISELNPSKNNLNIGVLVQKNKTGSQITEYLRQHTGLKITNDTKIFIAKDNAIGVALLSIFRISAHPEDGFSWGHIMMTPFKKMIETKYPNIEQLGDFVRSSIWKNQFTETLRKLVSSLGMQLDEFNSMRVDQLLKAASIFDKRGSRSIDAFVRFMENYTLRESGQPGTIQVMTIHQSKGITFDSVILPELEGNSFSSMNLGTEIKYNVAHDPEWILNMPNKRYIEIDSQLNKYKTSKVANETYEQICKFYVALTRAKYANYLITEESEITSKSDNFISLLSETIKSEDLNSGTLYSCGDPEWHKNIIQQKETIPKTRKSIPLPSENLRRKQNAQFVTLEVPEKLASGDIFK